MVAARQDPRKRVHRPEMGRARIVWRRVNFRARLRLFFVLLVILPMIALAIVLFTLTARSETGKADAGISAGTRHRLRRLRGARRGGRAGASREVAADPQLTARARLRHAASAAAWSS